MRREVSRYESCFCAVEKKQHFFFGRKKGKSYKTVRERFNLNDTSDLVEDLGEMLLWVFVRKLRSLDN